MIEPQHARAHFSSRDRVETADFRVNALHSEAGHDFLAIVEPTESGRAVLPWAKANLHELKPLLTRYGVLVLRGFAAETESFSAVADLFSPVSCKLQGQISPRTQIQGSVYTSTNFPAQYPIGQHHENCYDLFPPAYVFFYCHVPAPQGGETVVVDSRPLFAKINSKIVEKFERLGVMYVRNFTSSSPYKTLQDTFMADSPEAVAKYCKDHGINSEWIDGNLRATQRRGATTVHPETGNKAFFNVAHIWHWSAIVRAAQAFGGDIAERIRNNPPDRQWGNALYGDGSEIEESVIEEIGGLYQEHQRLIPWQTHDIVIIDNVTATHGRRPFTGERQIQVTVRAPSKTPYFPVSGQPTRLWQESL